MMGRRQGETNNNNNVSSHVVVAAATAGAMVAATLMAAWWHSSSSKERRSCRPKALHVTYRQPKCPSVMRYVAALPQSVRHYLVRMGNQPKVPLDAIDIVADSSSTSSSSRTGTALITSPYVEKKEIVPQKLWRVRYQYLRDPKMIARFSDILGIDLLNESNSNNCTGSSTDESTLKEMQKNQIFIDRIKTLVQDTKALDAKATAKKALEAGFTETQDMFVVRLDDDDNNSNSDSDAPKAKGLLLFNPCRVHPELLEYLDIQIGGKVKYIVSGSSFHTNQLPQAAAAFPQAKIICAQAANQKCMAAGMRPADYIYTNHTASAAASSSNSTATGGFDQAQSILAKEGIQLFHVRGETFTQSLVLVAYGHLLEVDLSPYGNGHRHLWVSDKDWNTSTSLSLGVLRLFFYGSIANAKVAPGYLPDYRVMGCDPTCLINKAFALDEPNPDGSSCTEMAESLRFLLTSVKFDLAHCVHSMLDDPLPANEYKDAINRCWSWLDGKSLLERQQQQHAS